MNRYSITAFGLIAATQSVIAADKPATTTTDHSRPDIILIMCDDMGFSDLACYGGEIRTPNIDYLASEGVRFTNFKNAGRSCPSRAALMTGYYQHKAQMGWMTAVDEHRPGYRGQIADNIPTIAEILRSNGYSTYMSGKWHLTVQGAFDAPNGSYPTQRGFDQYFGCLAGGGSYYAPKPLYRGEEPVKEIPDDFYYTTAITESAVDQIKGHNSSDPMFLYIAHFAPHLPLQAPKERVDACRERYEVGYDQLRTQRFSRQKAMGLIPEGLELPVYQREFNGNRPKWEDLEASLQQKWINDMATYAAMIEIMDDGIGEVIRAVKESGRYDNTVFLFMSDNGASSEGGFVGQLMADLSNTPYRSYKQWTYQGGTSAPLIISSSGEGLRGTIDSQPCHIIDIFPTCLDLAGASYPDSFKGNSVRLAGTTLTPALHHRKIASRDLYFEHQTSCAIISNGWKLVRNDAKSKWELINLEDDPFETNDLSARYPRKVKKLEKRWNRWAEQHDVLPFEFRPWTERINYYKALYPDQSGR